ncbi:interferon-induced very large GTPase 1 isoform X2 [Pseudorasbora parva]|uniref:interferon-induced very large GTPase 1 isoform X2 n=1 Tax=Pseudorasbora parva TaxID=51549 RepID=UPI00351F8042
MTTTESTVSEGEKLNLVVCGSDGPLKSSISEQILQQTDRRSDVELHGRQISLVELPALFNTQLSEEEVMRQTHRCVSLCDPGVHVLLFIIPDAPLNNEDKAEMETIQRIFSSRIKKHMMILIMQNSERQTAELNGESKTVIESFGGRHCFFGPTTQVSTLMEKVEQMLKDNRQEFFSTETFFDVQMKKLLQYEEKKKKRNPLETHLLSDSAESEDDLRIVLLGKTGVGKSATGNTILGRDAFKAELSHQSITKETQRETAETNGRHIAVIDTPGLFDTELTNEEIQREISNCISMILPGPHVFIIVLNLGQRFTAEEATSVKIIQETFGQNSLMFTMVLFTRGDYLKNKTIEEFIGKPGSAIRNLIEACGNRYHVFNNNQTGDRTQVSDLLEKIDAMVKANGGSFYSCKRFRQMEREKQEQQMKSLMDRVEQLNREREELMNKLEENKRMKVIMDEERQNLDKERKRRKEEDKIREREKCISDEQIQRLKSQMDGIIREKEGIEREKLAQLEDLEKRLKEERNMREAQQMTFNENLKSIEKQHEEEQKHFEEKMEYYKRYEDELKRRRVEWKEECEREKENMINKFYKDTDDSIQNKSYRKLETEYSKWTFRLRSAMMETEIKLHNKIENEAIHKIEETDLQRELKTTSEEVEKSMSDFFEKDKDKDTLIQWKRSFEIKIKEIQEDSVRETKRKLNEFLQQRGMKKEIDAQRTIHENTLYEKSKELALKLKDKPNDEETLKKEFDLFWEKSLKKIIKDTPPIKDIDIMRDVREILNDTYEERLPVHHWRERRDILIVLNYLDYVKIKTSSGFKGALTNIIRSTMKNLDHTLSKEDQAQIKSLVTDIVQQTDKMIQSFNISMMGYNISCIQQITGYIKASVMQHEEESVKYKFQNQFFIDLVYSICKRSNKMITDQHNMFREANSPAIYVEKKREEYYSVFKKYYHGATSAAIFGEIICQKLKEPIEQSVYKKTARELAGEMRTNCESLNGNRSKLEKHILKRLAEEEDFDKYMNYIKTPRDHFKSFIRDEVSRYITQFSVSVLLKMRKSIKLLQQKIMKAAHESTEHVQENRGNVGLWLKSFTQRLSDELIFSEKDLSGVKYVDDFSMLEDEIRQELPAIMSDICNRFNAESFSVNLDHKFRPDELLIDHFCQCCWVQCPFCRAVCTNTIEDHHGDHSVLCHRVRGINGTCYELTRNLCADTCTDLVESDQHFNTSGGRFPYKEYRRAGGIYAKWSIVSTDFFDQMYWKWFVYRFQKDLEKYYSKIFEGTGEIPDEWRKYSKQEAIESLDYGLQWKGETFCTIL